MPHLLYELQVERLPCSRIELENHVDCTTDSVQWACPSVNPPLSLVMTFGPARNYGAANLFLELQVDRFDGRLVSGVVLAVRMNARQIERLGNLVSGSGALVNNNKQP